MKNLMLLFLVLSLPIHTKSNTKVEPKSESVVDLEIETPKTTQAQKNAGELIVRIYQMDSKKFAKRNKNLASRIKKEILPVKGFSNYLSILAILNQLLASSSEQKKFEACIQANGLFPQTVNYLVRKIHNACIFLAKENIKKKKYLHFNLITRFIKNHLDRFLEIKFRPSLANFLKKTPKNYDKAVFGGHLTNYYVSNNIVPHPEIVPFISLNKTVTEILNKKGRTFSVQREKYEKELLSIIKKAYSIGGKEGKEGEIKILAKQAEQKVINDNDMLSTKFASPRLIDFSKFLIRNNLRTMARKILKKVAVANLVNEDDLQEYHFTYLWTYITEQNAGSAYTYIGKYALLDRFELLDSKLQYWIAKSLHDHSPEKNKNLYIELLRKIVQSNPLSFYGIVSLKEIKALNPKYYSEDVALYNKSFILPQGFSKSLSSNYPDRMIRFSVWSELGYSRLIESEFFDLKNEFENSLNPDRPEIQTVKRTYFHHYLTKILSKHQNYLNAFKIIYIALDANEIYPNSEFLKILFPNPFKNLIEKYDEKIDDVLISSLIRQESGFNPHARSRVGATGLMQLMYRTAKRFQKPLSSRSLLKPEVNIRIGINYLGKLMKRYDDNIVYTLAAYNAGESRVDNWKKTYFVYESIIHNIESIPFQETRKYVKLIYRNIFFYKLLDNKPLDVSESLNEIFDFKLGFKH